MRPPSARLALLSLMVALAALVVGCASVEKDKRALALEAATTGYQSAIRWGYYETAFGYLHPDLRKRKPLPDNLTDLRLASYEVVQPPTLQGKDNATQVVNIEYFYEDRQVVKRLTDRQVWKWDHKLESWWLQSGLPPFK